MTLNEYYELFELEQSERLTPGAWYTQKRYIVRDLLPVYGKCEPIDVDSDDIDDLINKTAKKYHLKQNTIHGVSASFASFFTFIVNLGDLSINPALPVLPPEFKHQRRNKKLIKKFTY